MKFFLMMIPKINNYQLTCSQLKISATWGGGRMPTAPKSNNIDHIQIFFSLNPKAYTQGQVLGTIEVSIVRH